MLNLTTPASLPGSTVQPDMTMWSYCCQTHLFEAMVGWTKSLPKASPLHRSSNPEPIRPTSRVPPQYARAPESVDRKPEPRRSMISQANPLPPHPCGGLPCDPFLDLAYPRGMQIPFFEYLLELTLASRLQYQHALLTLGEHDLVRIHPRLALRDQVQVNLDTGISREAVSQVEQVNPAAPMS